MKQTNSAIKFLMAQYRAIFKHAYFKGLVSATILTAGLAAGANNVYADSTLTGGGEDESKASAGTVTGDGTGNAASIGDNNNFFTTLTVGNKSTLDINNKATIGEAKNGLIFSEKFSIASGGTVNVGTTVYASIDGFNFKDGGYDGTIENYGTFNIGGESSNGRVQLKTINLKSGSTTTITGTQDEWYSVSMLVGGLRDSGGITIDDGATLNLHKNSQLVASQNSTIEINGDVALQADVDGDAAFIRGSDNFSSNTNTFTDDSAAIINIGKTAQITAKSGAGKIGIYAAEVNINGNNDATTISVESGAKLEFDGDINTATDDKKLKNATFGAGQFTMNSGVINIDTDGTLIVGSGAFTDSTTNKKYVTTLDIKGGKLTGAGTLQVDGNLSVSDTILSGFTSSGQVELGASSETTLTSENNKSIDLGKYTFSGGASETADFVVADSAKVKAANLSVTKEISDATNLSVIAEDTLTLGNGTYDGGDQLFKTISAKNVVFNSTSAFILADTLTLSSTRTVTSGSTEIEVSDNGQIVGDFIVKGDSGELTIKGGIYESDGDITLADGKLQVLKANDIDLSSLTLSDNLILDNTSGENTIKVSGTGSTLDLSNADVKVTTHATNYTKITVSGTGASLIIKGDDVEEILAQTSGVSGSGIHLNLGSLKVTDSVELTETQITAGTDVTSGNLTFDSDGSVGGTLEVGETLTITGSTGYLNIGAGGKVLADKLALNNASAGSTNLTNGTYTVLTGLSTNADTDTVKLSNATTLNLGQLSGTTAVGGGNLANLSLEGTSTANVYGSWTGKKLSSAANLNVTSQGNLTVNELTVSAGTTSVSGTMTVNGIVNSSTASGSGLSLAEGSVDLTGKLVFGSGVADDISVSTNGTTSTVSGSGGIAAQAIDINGGTLQINFSGDKEFTTEELKALKKHIFAEVSDSGTIDGTLHIGDAKIAGMDLGKEDVNGRFDFDNVAGVADVTGGNISNNELTNNSFTTTDGQNIAGSVGSIHVTSANKATINQSAGFVNSATNNGFFASVSGASGDVAADIDFNGTKLSLENGGQAGNITLNSGELVVKGSADQQTVLGKVSGSSAGFTVQGPTVAKTVNIKTLKLDEGFSLKADTLSVSNTSGTTSLKGVLEVSGEATFDNNVEFTSQASIGGDLNAEKNLDVKGNVVVNGTSEIKNNATVAENANFISNEIKLTSGKTFKIGQDSTETTSGSTGYAQSNRLDAQGATVIVDPDYSQGTSIAVFGQVGKSGATKAAGGLVQGNFVAAQNSIFALGVDDATSAEALNEIKGTFAKLMNSNGSLNEKNVGSILYIGKAIEVEDGSKLISNAQSTGAKAEQDLAAVNMQRAVDALYSTDGYIGKNSVIAISDAALGEDSTSAQGAVHFSKPGATIYSESGSKVILVGDSFNTRDSITLFTDEGSTSDDTSGVEIVGNKLRVETLNGLFYFDYEAGEETTSQNLRVNPDQIDYVFSDASGPVRDTLLTYATRDHNWENEGNEGYVKDSLHGSVAKGITTTDGSTFLDKNGTVDKNKYIALQNSNGEWIKDDQGNIIVYHAAFNSFLDYVSSKEMTGQAAEQASRLGVFGGAAQAALSAGATTYDAISGRMGVGAQTGSITFADNGQGAGLWVSPIYKSHDSDGFASQGPSYGVDMSMYGLALGGDFTMANGLRVGAAFNLGSGDADGQGMGSGVSNDFSYYGFSVYGGFSMDKFSLVGDISYTVVDNDVTANTLADKVSTSFDSNSLSIGVTGQYALDFNGLSVIPHAGLRYTNVDLDDYSIKGEKFGDIGNYGADGFNVVSVPVGVTFAKEITAGTWTVKPAFDLTLTANMGDDSVDGTVTWTGIENLDTKVQSEVVDSFTYGATLGVSAKSGNMSFGFGVNYTGASSADEYGVQANARFVF